MNFIQRLSELDRGDLASAGGKAANLGALIQAGLPIPPGFCVITTAYRAFIEANHLAGRIHAALSGLDAADPAALDAASQALRAAFEAGQMPEEIASEIRRAYAELAPEAPAVAVRSSATAEDLPDLSFAGQQDTYLNVAGADAVISAVVRCWGSLWTARAIAYRARSRISQEEVALAAVVQAMVQSETSGVLFTTNPLSGRRAETVIDATFGLGEALVSGQVEPDHYAVEDEKILHKTLGQKALLIRSLPGGGVEKVAGSSAELQALPDAQIVELSRLGRRAERYFGAPQDMEWAWAGGRLYVLQSRPITSLYPLPEEMELSARRDDPHPPLPGLPEALEPQMGKPVLEALFSFGAWQGMLEPFSPLGRDAFTGLIVGLGRAVGVRTTYQDQRSFLCAGERLFVNITGLLRHPTGRKIVEIFVDSIDPVSMGVIQDLVQRQEFSLRPQKFDLPGKLRLALGFAPVLGGVIYNEIAPTRGRERLERKITSLLARISARSASVQNLAELAELLETTPQEAPNILLPYLLPGVIAGMAPLQMLLRMPNPLPNGELLVQELTRGLPHNVTTEMDLKLWEAAASIRADAPARACFSASEPAQLAALYRARQLPPAAQAPIEAFFKIYGLRGVGEIDILRPRWEDDPTHIFQVLKSYLEIDGPSPADIFSAGVERARRAQAELEAGFRRLPLGWLRAGLVHFLARRVRELGGLRETPKFAIVRILGVLRQALLKIGQRLAAEGILQQADDLFYLHIWEMKALAAQRLPDPAGLIAARRSNFAREAQRRRIPRILLSDGVTFYDGAAKKGQTGENALSGTPVSAGVVEGLAHVILDPRGARLSPGEILVCPATDPAWTPLFLAAGGLVMEVGGMMTHGSVVAREYGIPAVVGVPEATTRLKTGQRIRVDGSSGVVEIL